MKKVILSLLCVVSLMAAATPALADQSQYKKLNLSGSKTKYKALDLPSDSVKKSSRLTWSTNMVEWLMFAPNVGLEIDLKDPTLISCPSLFFQFSYRPGKEDFLKHESYSTNALYYWRARAEYRWHFRFNERREQRRGLVKAANWMNEKMMTKKIETQVPDTAARNAGNEGAMMTVMSTEGRIEQKIDSTMRSTIERKIEMFPGRYYLGAYGEYANFTYNNRMIPIFGKNLKQGVIYSMGLSGGYDFPGFNYNHKCFLQWSVGASLGLMWFNYDTYGQDASKQKPTSTGTNKILPFITELKVGLNFRNSTISKKYWQPDPSVYAQNLIRNHEDSIHMAELDTILEQHPVIINVTSVNGFDSAYVEIVDKLAIVNAFRQSTGLTYLMPNDFVMLESTAAGLEKKELSDNYFIEYTTTNRLRNYEDSVFTSDRKNLPFKLQIAGREHADSLKQSFVDSMKSYYAANNSRPIFYGEPATRDSLKGFISKDTIAAQFSRIWGHPMDTSMIRTLYAAHNVTEDDGTFTTYYDSVITEQQVNRREAYAMFIQFHPQVTLSGEDEGVGRFRVAMAGADNAREQFNKVATFINKLAKAGMGGLRIQRPWNGKDDSFEQPVSKEEILALMENYGMEGLDPRVVFVDDTIKHFHAGADTINFNFGVTENPLRLNFTINDSIGLAQAKALMNDTIKPWKDEQYWQPSQGLYDDDPKVPGYYDSITNEWYVNPEKFIDAVADIIFTRLKPYMVDTVTWRVNAKPYRTGQLAGKYRAQAKIIFHREWKARTGLWYTNIPYLIVPVETKEEAGWVEPVVETPATDSLAYMRDSVVYTLDSLGNVIDSTIVKVLNTAALPTDSLGNVVLDSIQGDSAMAAALRQVVPAVEEGPKQLTVAEATEASTAAAALAKTTAAEAKTALAAAKKAKANATKQAKLSAAAIKKAQASVKEIPDSVVVTSESVEYIKDSLDNVVDSTVVKVEKKVANELNEEQQAAIVARDSIIAAQQALADEAVQQADSLQAVADEAAAKAAETKTAAAEAKKAVAEAKKAEKLAAAEAKKRAKEEAAAAKAAAKAAAAEAKTVAEETVQAATEAAAPAAAAASEPAPVAPAATPAPAAPVVETPAAEVKEEAAPARDMNNEEEGEKPMSVAEATQISNEAAATAKQAAADAKALMASLKKAKADQAKAQKVADAAVKKLPQLAEDEEITPEVEEARIQAKMLQNTANAAQIEVDKLQEELNTANQKVAETKAAAAEAKKAIAEAKKAEKAALAAQKAKAKAEAAAAKAAAKAEADAKKAAEKAAAEAAKQAKEAAETVTEAATEAAAESTDAKEE